MRKETVSVIGAGSWGTTLAVMLAKKGVGVTLWSVFDTHNAVMRKERQNRQFLAGVRFPRSCRIASSLIEALSGSIIIIAIPVKYVRGIVRKIARTHMCLGKKIFVSVSKGIEPASLQCASRIISDELNSRSVAVLSGPNIAREVAAGVPSASIVACRDRKTGKRLQVLFTTPAFRVYFHRDVTGVELGGALKNIIALACGVSDGLGFGANTKAALVTRGLVEIARLGKKMGAQPLTLQGISGLGDLVTTCFSPYSRNRSVGEAIGRGKKLISITQKMAMVAEGVGTVKSAYRLSRKLKVDMPITTQVYSVLYKNKSPRKAVSSLMKRPLKEERIGG